MDTDAIKSRCDTPPDRRAGWNDTLGTWRLCRKRICQRRKHCCGEPYACLKTSLRLLPESVQLWMMTLMECRAAGLPFEDAMAQLEGTWAEEGYIAWREAIGQPVTVQDT